MEEVNKQRKLIIIISVVCAVLAIGGIVVGFIIWSQYFSKGLPVTGQKEEEIQLTPYEELIENYGDLFGGTINFGEDNNGVILTIGNVGLTFDFFQEVYKDVNQDMTAFEEKYDEIVEKVYLIAYFNSDQDSIDITSIKDLNSLNLQYLDLADRMKNPSVRGNIISIWFDNDLQNRTLFELGYSNRVPPGTYASIDDLPAELKPEISLTEAKTYAWELMTKVRGVIMTEGRSFYDASRMIVEDNYMPQIDDSYQMNAYIEFDVLEDESAIISDSELSKEIWSADVGQVSEIKELFQQFLIYTVTERNEGISIESILEESKSTYEIKVIY